jgi:hypothetical protein
LSSDREDDVEEEAGGVPRLLLADDELKYLRLLELVLCFGMTFKVAGRKSYGGRLRGEASL